MDLMKYSKPLALTAVLALVAGCSGSGGTQPGDGGSAMTSTEMHQSDGAGGSGGAQAAGAGDESAAEAEALAAERAAAERAAAEAEAAAQAARDAIERPEIMTIYFDFDQSTIRSEFYDVLNAHAVYLQANSDAQITLEGHADERGTREYNMALGERRGSAVQRYLSLQGVSSEQMEVVSYGEERPVVRNARTAEDHAKNRRVELNY